LGKVSGPEHTGKSARLNMAHRAAYDIRSVGVDKIHLYRHVDHTIHST
jgi:hypothetical protein